MSDLVRVQDPKTHDEYTIGRDHAEAVGLRILKDKPAVDSIGVALPAKLHVDLPKSATKKTASATKKTASAGENKE